MLFFMIFMILTMIFMIFIMLSSHVASSDLWDPDFQSSLTVSVVGDAWALLQI